MERLPVPPHITAIVGPNPAWHRPFQGMASETTLLRSERGSFVLKRGRGARQAAELAAEQRVLHALRTYRPFVPEPLAFVMEGEDGLSLLRAIDGTNLVEAVRDADTAGRHALVAVYAWALRRVHGWAPQLPRPLDWLDRALARAGRRVSRGDLTTPIALPGRFEGAEPEALIAWLRRIQPAIRGDLVFCHQDACMPNVLVGDGRATGVVDWAKGAYADRRFDLATACWSIGFNLGDEAYQQTFLRAYGYGGDIEGLRPFEALYALE